MKSLGKICFVLLCIAAATVVIGRVGLRSENGIDKVSVSEKLTEEAGNLLESAGALVGELVNGYKGFEGYDIEEATMFDEAYPIWEGDLVQKLELGEAASLEIELGGCIMELLASESGEAQLIAENMGKLQVYQQEETLYIRGTRKALEDAAQCRLQLYLPAEHLWQSAELEIGAGSVTAAGLQAEQLRLTTGAGQIMAEGLCAETLEVSVGAGEINISEMNAGALQGEVGVGTLKLQGSIREKVEANCSVGNLTLEVTGAQEDYNYELSGVLGKIMLGGKHYSEKVEELTIDNGADRYMDLNCSVGNVVVTFSE